MKLRTIFQALVASLVVLLPLGWVLGSNQYALSTGDIYWLETGGRDPRDLMRGDFVNYRFPALVLPTDFNDPKLAHIPEFSAAAETGAVFEPNQLTLFALMEADENNVLMTQKFSTSKPDDDQPFIRGKISGWQLRLAIPAEKYFVQEGTGLELEKLDRPFAKISLSKGGRVNILEIVSRDQVPWASAPESQNQ